MVNDRHADLERQLQARPPDELVRVVMVLGEAAPRLDKGLAAPSFAHPDPTRKAWLDPEQLSAVSRVAADHELQHSRESLLSGLDHALRSSLPREDGPWAQLLSDLDRLNQIERLSDGTIPLQVWLSNALTLARSTDGTQLLTAALASVVGQWSTDPVTVTESSGLEALDPDPRPDPTHFPDPVAHRQALIDWKARSTQRALGPIREALERLGLQVKGGTVGRTVVVEGPASDILAALDQVPGIASASLDTRFTLER